ncbi:MAG TPA: DUF6788 family protein, partial [Candidatus Acidoferrales bacterium]|nr:DUF6788 family protein [Candidatus Acidoferrales bacterium]
TALDKRIAAIKAELAALGPLRPGSLSQQYNVCGNPRCRCKADPPQKHSPYYQLSYTFRGKSHSDFVRRDALPQVRAQMRNYETLRALVDEWIALSIALARGARSATSPQTKRPPKRRPFPKPRSAPR